MTSLLLKARLGRLAAYENRAKTDFIRDAIERRRLRERSDTVVAFQSRRAA